MDYLISKSVAENDYMFVILISGVKLSYIPKSLVLRPTLEERAGRMLATHYHLRLIRLLQGRLLCPPQR